MTLQDKRTEAEMKEDYRYGKEMEAKVFEHLKKFGKIEKTNSSDKRLHPGKYNPDCIIEGKFGRMPVEIKCSRVDIPYVHWKVNQYEEAKRVGGYLLIVIITEKKFCLISSDEEGELLKSGYCNKPVMVFKKIHWYNTSDFYKLFKRDVS